MEHPEVSEQTEDSPDRERDVIETTEPEDDLRDDLNESGNTDDQPTGCSTREPNHTTTPLLLALLVLGMRALTRRNKSTGPQFQSGV